MALQIKALDVQAWVPQFNPQTQQVVSDLHEHATHMPTHTYTIK